LGRLKRFLSKRVPPLQRIVLVESGAREIFEKLLPALYGHCPHIDVVTCFGGPPANFDTSRGDVYEIGDYQGRDGRKRLYSELWAKSYSAVGVICADQDIMTKWKWAIAAQLPGKLFIVNENVDYFWVDRGNWKLLRHFILFRAGLSGADAVRTLTQLAIFPFTVLFLLLWAAQAHARRYLFSRTVRPNS
jgi:hypothetical protein